MAKVTTAIDWAAVRKTRHLKRKMKPPKISKAVKYGLAFFNGLFWGLGLLLTLAGSYSISSSDTASIRLTSVFSILLNISVTLLLVGLAMVVVSLAGILGSLRENLQLLRFYRHCIVGFLFLEFGLVLFCFTYPNHVVSVASRDLPRGTIVAYLDDANMQNLMNFVQRRFRCCGVSDQGFLDWSLNMYFNCSDANPSAERCSVPWSCCLDPDRSAIRNYACGRDVQRLTAFEAMHIINTDGCITAIAHWVIQHSHIVGASFIAVAFTQGAVMYQSTRICIILERMRPPGSQPPARPPLFSKAMALLVISWLTRQQTQPDPEAPPPASQDERRRQRTERKRRKEEKREAKKREAEKREKRGEEDGESVSGSSSSSEEDLQGSAERDAQV